MSPDFETPHRLAPPLFINTNSLEFVGLAGRTIANNSSTASSTWTANLAIYMPFAIPWPYPVRRVFWFNGSTASSNCDIGIYTVDGTRIWSSGSTGQSGASVLQYVTPATEILLSPGQFYLAFACSGTTNRVTAQAIGTAAIGRSLGLLEQGSALPLPSTATFATYATNLLMPWCGITRTSSGF